MDTNKISILSFVGQGLIGLVFVVLYLLVGGGRVAHTHIPWLECRGQKTPTVDASVTLRGLCDKRIYLLSHLTGLKLLL